MTQKITLTRIKSNNAILEEVFDEYATAIEAVANREFVHGRNMLISEDKDRVVFEAVMDVGDADAPAGATLPFDLIVTPILPENPEDEPTEATVLVVPGTVNGMVPSNIFTEHTIVLANTVYFMVDVVTDGKAVSACSMSFDADTATPATATPFGLPEAVSIVVGVVHLGVAYRTIGNGSIAMNGVRQYVVEKEQPLEPGEMNYTPYYNWQISVA